MDVNRELFWEDIDSGEVHIRDKLQFALKSEFTPQRINEESRYIQEFYLFIPSSLQINSKTYSENNFYLDQTTLIRYKTPEFSFNEIIDPDNHQSPLTRIALLCQQLDSEENRTNLTTELKLFANVIRSALRKHSKEILELLNNPNDSLQANMAIHELCGHILKIRELYNEVQKAFLMNWKDLNFFRKLLYIDEFLSDAILHYLTDILKQVRLQRNDLLDASDAAITQILLDEKYQNDLLLTFDGSLLQDKGETKEGETYLYRSNLLNKFILEPLMLSTNRFSFKDRYKHTIGAISAGIAILIYLVLFAWLGRNFVLNSTPFIALASAFYILKDRIKEWIKTLSYQKASALIPDYETIIRSLEFNQEIGILSEDFSYVDQSQLPQEIRVLRNAEFHAVLETFQRPEDIIYYKREIKLHPVLKKPAKRRISLNIIFRFNINHFLRQASEPVETHLTLDPKTKNLVTVRLPKVYHINLIIKSTTITGKEKPKITLEKLRLVVDKNGIRRIERV